MTPADDAKLGLELYLTLFGGSVCMSVCIFSNPCRISSALLVFGHGNISKQQLSDCLFWLSACLYVCLPVCNELQCSYSEIYFICILVIVIPGAAVPWPELTQALIDKFGEASKAGAEAFAESFGEADEEPGEQDKEEQAFEDKIDESGFVGLALALQDLPHNNFIDVKALQGVLADDPELAPPLKRSRKEDAGQRSIALPWLISLWMHQQDCGWGLRQPSTTLHRFSPGENRVVSLGEKPL